MVDSSAAFLLVSADSTILFDNAAYGSQKNIAFGIAAQAPNINILAEELNDNGLYTVLLESDSLATYQWSINGIDAGIGDSLSHQFNDDGLYELQITAIYPNGAITAFTQAVEVTVFTAIESITNSFPFDLSQVGNQLYLTNNVTIKGINLYNSMGQNFWSNKTNEPNYVISLNAYPTGIYFIQVQTSAGIFVKRIIRH